VHSGDSRCGCGYADPLTRDKLTCCPTRVQAKPRIWVQYYEDGVPRSILFNPLITIDELAEAAVSKLPQLHGRDASHVAAFEATYDKVTRTATVEGRDLDPCCTLAELGIAADNHIVFELRAPPAAATGGAGTSSGEW
jgi:hypothetical protein